MPRVIEIIHPYLREGFWKTNRFWEKDTYSQKSKTKIETALLAS
jgi:hypothetical protein